MRVSLFLAKCCLLRTWAYGILIAFVATAATSVAAPPVVLLYHKDAKVRIDTIEQMAIAEDAGLVDDLIRAQSVEFYTPVHNTYQKALSRLTGVQVLPAGMNWKAWLDSEVEARRIKVDYRPVEPSEAGESDRSNLQPLASQLGPEHFNAMAERLRSSSARVPDGDALRYMVANDHLPEVRQFLSGIGWHRRSAGRTSKSTHWHTS